jgi:hypothetical protein
VVLAVCPALLATSSCTRVVNRVTATLSATVAPVTSPPPSLSSGPTGGAAIVVRAPSSGAEISSPVRISGTADVFEGVVSFQVVDATGEVLAATNTTASCGSGCRGAFHATLAFFTPLRQHGAVEAYEVSEKDGSMRHLVRVAVTLVPGT